MTANWLLFSVMHFMREIMKLPGRDTLFIKMGYDFPNIPPRYLLLHNPIVLNTVHDASTSQRYSGSVASKHRAIPV